MDLIYDAIILYDDHCRLCRKLASLMAFHIPKGWHLQSWQSYALTKNLSPKSDKLRVLVGDDLLEDQEAWEFIVMNIPQLKKHLKLASRLGLYQISISAVTRSGRLLRYFCGRCGR